MPHQRNRHMTERLLQAAKLWPVIGVLGPRQSGKTTLLTKLLGLENCVSMDDLETKTEANESPKTFLSKHSCPLVIDEAQKAPNIFDAIKLDVDCKKIPGKYYLTGSTAFSKKIDIRESLTGRILNVELSPFTLAETEQKNFKNQNFNPDLGQKPRFSLEQFTKRMVNGGMPVPAFLRNREEQNQYWNSWIETTLYRDLAQFIPRSYDPDFAYSILNQMAKIMSEGEMPTLKHFKQKSVKLRKYLDAMTLTFLLKKFYCNENGVGKEIWYFFDSGLAAYFMQKITSEEANLTLARHTLMNEFFVSHIVQGKRFTPQYFKLARSGLTDFIIDGVPFKVVGSPKEVSRQKAWTEKPLLAAMKKLDSPVGFLLGPTEKIDIPKKGIGVLPWHYFS